MKKLASIILMMCFVLFSCTDLDEQVLDTAVGEGILDDPAAAAATLAPVYAQYNSVYSHHNTLYNMQSIASDESIVPFRGGTDWFDGGRFIEMHQHTWTPTHVTVREVWSDLTQGIAKAAVARQTLSELDHPDQALYSAEARAMGAFWNMVLLDLYGLTFEKLPENVGTTELSTIYRGEEAVNFIISEFDAAEPNLGTFDQVGSTRMTKAATWALKARLLLNKAVYVDRYANSFNFSQQDMDEVINYTTMVINTGDYALEEDNYFSMWNIDNHDHQEHIFAFQQTFENEGQNRHAWFGSSRARHGSLVNLNVTGSDGVSQTTEFYDMWEGNRNDPRYFQRNTPDSGSIPEEEWEWNRGIQIGQQYGIVLNDEGTDFKRDENGDLVIEPLVDTPRSGLPLNYTREVGLTQNTNHITGARALKFQFDPLAIAGQRFSRVNIPVIRIADMYLMRAEAHLRNGDAGLALDDVNAVRSARGADLLSSIDMQSMEMERVYEFYSEMLRRTDMVRFGKWEDSWIDKTSSNPIRRLFPIPQDAIDAASGEPGYLEQNQGY
ncbi:RagB/SusD family nutrient uptake outer membrane protein [Aliifodinibius sp. S!AR15-10]|uniref:RagB/SusD family nutrient uptake outer membrane protein n=1 Tax=Aliifodinibius sp. S!AR15-10 TaxID=2950437 RepID=UPI00285975E5|nr:RagB/SusD family nutrient uptake outer membrane protein [Aliifodinibius sp. S!AR15-10]MDR8391731.1 RagB/SusD family nutrient uptake outer membrane protein [Aliifodinibius sp. S!AR15-10]